MWLVYSGNNVQAVCQTSEKARQYVEDHRGPMPTIPPMSCSQHAPLNEYFKYWGEACEWRGWSIEKVKYYD